MTTLEADIHLRQQLAGTASSQHCQVAVARASTLYGRGQLTGGAAYSRSRPWVDRHLRARNRPIDLARIAGPANAVPWSRILHT